MTMIHEDERGMSLTMAFARALRRMELYPAPLAKKQMLDAVATGDSVAVAKMLKKKPGAALWYARSHEGRMHTMFEFALGEGKFGVASMMTQFCPEVLKRDYSMGETFCNRTILMQRCIVSSLRDEIQFLVDSKVDVNAKDDSGDTALHFAAGLSKQDTARILLSALPDVNAANNAGVTPVMEATKGDNKVMLDIMIGAGGNIHAVDAQGRNVVMHAFHNSNVPAVRRLMDMGATIDFNDPAVATLCRVATHEGEIPFVIALGEYEKRAQQKGELEFDYAGSLDKGLPEGITVAKPIRLKGRAP